MAKRSELSLAPGAMRQCSCQPLSSLHNPGVQKQEDEECEQVIAVSQELGQQVHLALAEYFPRTTPLSMLLLHISQWEYKQVGQQSTLTHQRHRFHAPETFLDQVLINLRRAIRNHDQILIHPSAGAVLFFPNVDEPGIHSILDRVYRNVSLLQAETVIPPLKYETDILLGVGSYPQPGMSIEQLLSQVSIPAQRFTLRPAIMPQFWGIAPVATPLSIEGEQQHSRGRQKRGITPSAAADRPEERADQAASNAGSATVPPTPQVPFMQLPVQLPKRLKHLIPYQLARELRCAPVGRDHHYLTVALSNPADRHAIERLKGATGMTIFPVCCNEDALNELLNQPW